MLFIYLKDFVCVVLLLFSSQSSPCGKRYDHSIDLCSPCFHQLQKNVAINTDYLDRYTNSPIVTTPIVWQGGICLSYPLGENLGPEA